MNKMAIVLVPILLAACASTPDTSASKAAQTRETKSSLVATGAGKKGSVSSAEVEAGKLAAEMQELQKQSIYFDFDKYDVKPEYWDVIQKQAAFIKTHKNGMITVEGNADERGSNEYNLALGDKRANAARKNLELLGIPASQIRTTSYGEEKPRLSCREEKCWKENRRDDFVHRLN